MVFEMKIVGLKILHDFMKKHPDVKGALLAWIAIVKAANWSKNTDLSPNFPPVF